MTMITDSVLLTESVNTDYNVCPTVCLVVAEIACPCINSRHDQCLRFYLNLMNIFCPSHALYFDFVGAHPGLFLDKASRC